MQRFAWALFVNLFAADLAAVGQEKAIFEHYAVKSVAF